jgi:predicted nucleic acid-binding protein
MMRIFIETSVFNRYLENGREYSAETRILFNKIAVGEIEAFTSNAVIDEIIKAPEPKRGYMLELITSNAIAVLEVDQAAYELADLYIEMGVIPARFRFDGIHIATAAIHGMDCIVSLNFHHINKLKTKTATEIIHRMKGYSNPYICSPMEVIYND